MEPEALYENFYNGLLFTTSNEYVWSKIFLIFMHGLESAILAILKNSKTLSVGGKESAPPIN